MPLIVLCGLPASGKTMRAKELQNYFENKRNIRTCVVSDHGRSLRRVDIYHDSAAEKQMRSTLKSEVQRALNRDEVLIFDSLNYIKGYRYEIYCIIKSAQTPQCLVYCATTSNQASEWNKSRPDDEAYPQDLFDGLVMRFEAPDSRNRWDSPLFLAHPDEPLPLDSIFDALFLSKAPPPNQSTLPQPLSATNFLHEIDSVTQSIVQLIVETQKTSVGSTLLTVPNASDKVVLNRTLTFMELQRLRREFISFTKTHPVDNTAKIANMFVQFLNRRTQ